MDKIICIECRTNYDSNMEECPNCGCPTNITLKNVNANNKGYSLFLKVLLIISVWGFGGLFISMIFGDQLIGTLIQMIFQIYLTIYIIRLPKKRR